MQKLKVQFFIKVDNIKNGVCPIFGKIIIGKSSATFSTGRKILPERWEKTDGLRGATKSPSETSIKEYLQVCIVGDELAKGYWYLWKQFPEFTPPASAEKLERLRLSDCPALIKIGKCNFPLTLSLDIENTGFESFPVLTGVKKLTNLDVTNCSKLENLDGLKGIEGIEENDRLSLSGCTKLKDISGIAHFKGIALSLEVNELPEIKMPNGIVNLQAGEIKSLKNIELYSELERLNVISSKITSLASLSALKKLRFLDISKNEKIKSLKGIELLEWLETLVLLGLKNLEDISALDKLVLQKIYIQGCKKKKSDFPSHLQSAIDWQTTWGFQ